MHGQDPEILTYLCAHELDRVVRVLNGAIVRGAAGLGAADATWILVFVVEVSLRRVKVEQILLEHVEREEGRMRRLLDVQTSLILHIANRNDRLTSLVECETRARAVHALIAPVLTFGGLCLFVVVLLLFRRF